VTSALSLPGVFARHCSREAVLSQSCHERLAFAAATGTACRCHPQTGILMQARPLAVITLRRELAARHARMQRLWRTARNAYRRLAAAPVQDLLALRHAAQRLDTLDRGRAALLSDLKALAD